MSEAPVRFGLIGYGAWGQHHAKAIAKTSGAELVAIALTLAAHDSGGQFLIELSKTSFFVLWLALLGAAVMCQFKNRLESSGATRAFVISFIVLEAICLLLAEMSWQLTRIFAESSIIHDTHGNFILRTFAVSSIVIALAMRYLYVSSEWRRSIVLEAQARISALQALIRPHFLFNSMNTIASLISFMPEKAEKAIEDLADLFRASLAQFIAVFSRCVDIKLMMSMFDQGQMQAAGF